MSHFIELCRICGTVISQCRCAGPNKEQRWGICEDCKKMDKSDAIVITNNDKFIEIGDIVDVYFENSNAIFHAELLSIPFKTGDCFIVKRTSDNSIYYIQNFSYMRKCKKDE